MKEITTRLHDIKMLLQELVNETRLKRQADSPRASELFRVSVCFDKVGGCREGAV
jgi:hypothetical protein